MFSTAALEGMLHRLPLHLSVRRKVVHSTYGLQVKSGNLVDHLESLNAFFKIP